MIQKRLLLFGCALAALVIVAVQHDVLAGPPLTCHPFEIGDAKSLPWGGNSWSDTKTDYDRSRLVDDTQALLTPDTPVIVRMETLRRAALYAHQKDQRLVQQLLDRLLARARGAEAKGQPDGLAWFDVGYLVETYRQASWTYKKKNNQEWARIEPPSPVTGLDGYAWMVKALGLRGNDPEMEFAAAIAACTEYRNGRCVSEIQRKRQDEHLQKAANGAADGSLLAKNLVSRFSFRGGTLAELRAKTAKQ
jgi:hypothetical protein